VKKRIAPGRGPEKKVKQSPSLRKTPGKSFVQPAPREETLKGKDRSREKSYVKEPVFPSNSGQLITVHHGQRPAKKAEGSFSAGTTRGCELTK